MEIFIDDIPEEGLTVRANSKADKWLLEVVKNVIGERFTGRGEASVTVTFIRFEGNIDVTGDLDIVSYPACDRCLKPYREELKIPFHLIMAPMFESRKGEVEEKEPGLEEDMVSDDMGFSFYEGDRIDLDEIVREYLLLEDPIKHICKEDCKGLCHRCGKDLNEGPCGCVEKHHDPRWDALKQFKPAKTGKTSGSKLKVQSSKKKV